eukprot:CAMPEP_0206371562 /NCGR_PEP_ID=MMETSP0294-20121207/6555_1 /ASSEMBLY_ACC=CAM_ASM_000327 /TAXON_ID=39354 /ORGANISM="Heterosigma akashiwo, Strain CCMP2393" /LENGTH=127 /DNA_ID=CAMNT_0053818709 /DNA_START=134 /DNA_END=514 /DNA_ORIENTATION=+
MRQFDPKDATGTKLKMPVADFLAEVNRLYNQGEYALVDGYASFCKHIFLPNFPGLRSSTIAITEENRHLLRTGYEARREGELPVLTRWFPAHHIGELPEARYLDVILYSREQVKKEDAARGIDSGSE